MFPVRISLAVQWGEMDSYGHVNNTVYFRWFESARMECFARLGWPAVERDSGVGPILHSTRARFRAPLTWPDTVDVATRITNVLSDRFTMLYEVGSRALERVVAEGEGTIVAFDYRRLEKAPLPEPIRTRIEELERASAEEVE
jgi:acyl-CoA thioester hydrolase